MPLRVPRSCLGQPNTGDKLRSSEVHQASSASSPCSAAPRSRLRPFSLLATRTRCLSIRHQTIRRYPTPRLLQKRSAHVGPPVTGTNLVCRLLLEKKCNEERSWI